MTLDPSLFPAAQSGWWRHCCDVHFRRGSTVLKTALFAGGQVIFSECECVAVATNRKNIAILWKFDTKVTEL
jgi:hypothetical protein